jgi:hypothetical protein
LIAVHSRESADSWSWPADLIVDPDAVRAEITELEGITMQ